LGLVYIDGPDNDKSGAREERERMESEARGPAAGKCKEELKESHRVDRNWRELKDWGTQRFEGESWHWRNAIPLAAALRGARREKLQLG
jgi:hypothetical protein